MPPCLPEFLSPPPAAFLLLLCAPQAPDGAVHVAAAAGSALQPAAIGLLEVPSVDALAASKPDDWQLVQLSAATPVRRLQRWA